MGCFKMEKTLNEIVQEGIAALGDLPKYILSTKEREDGMIEIYATHKEPRFAVKYQQKTHQMVLKAICDLQKLGYTAYFPRREGEATIIDYDMLRHDDIDQEVPLGRAQIRIPEALYKPLDPTELAGKVKIVQLGQEKPYIDIESYVSQYNTVIGNLAKQLRLNKGNHVEVRFMESED